MKTADGSPDHQTPSPLPTSAALAVTLLGTIAAVAQFLRRTEVDDVDATVAGGFLVFFTVLFAVRVGGQLLVARVAPRWLPPMDRWNLMPYRLLLPIQLVLLVVMSWIALQLIRDDGFVAEPHRAFGLFAVGFSFVYSGSMVVRYAVRMRRRPSERWFGGAIPIVFHVVLAAFVFVYGTYHASH